MKCHAELIVILGVSLLMITGCAASTKYRKAAGEKDYGYQVHPHSTKMNVFVATFIANCDTTTKQAQDYVIRTIKEFCEDPGDLQYRLVPDKDNTGADAASGQSLVYTSDCNIVPYDRAVQRCDEWRKDWRGSDECIRYTTWNVQETKREGVVKAWAAFQCFQKFR